VLLVPGLVELEIWAGTALSQGWFFLPPVFLRGSPSPRGPLGPTSFSSVRRQTLSFFFIGVPRLRLGQNRLALFHFSPFSRGGVPFFLGGGGGGVFFLGGLGEGDLWGFFFLGGGFLGGVFFFFLGGVFFLGGRLVFGGGPGCRWFFFFSGGGGGFFWVGGGIRKRSGWHRQIPLEVEEERPGGSLFFYAQLRLVLSLFFFPRSPRWLEGEVLGFFFLFVGPSDVQVRLPLYSVRQPGLFFFSWSDVGSSAESLPLPDCGAGSFFFSLKSRILSFCAASSVGSFFLLLPTNCLPFELEDPESAFFL